MLTPGVIAAVCSCTHSHFGGEGVEGAQNKKGGKGKKGWEKGKRGKKEKGKGKGWSTKDAERWEAQGWWRAGR